MAAELQPPLLTAEILRRPARAGEKGSRIRDERGRVLKDSRVAAAIAETRWASCRAKR
jgi:hypothetical protein